jgi:glutaryl-CoA dehydrogenase
MMSETGRKLARSLGTDFYLIDELLTDEERGIRDRVRAFCDKEVIPIINDYWERAEVPFELIPKIAALKVAGGSIKGYGCPEMSTIAAGLVLQELSRADASLCVVFGATSSLAMTSIAMLGSETEAALASANGAARKTGCLWPD